MMRAAALIVLLPGLLLSEDPPAKSAPAKPAPPPVKPAKPDPGAALRNKLDKLVEGSPLAGRSTIGVNVVALNTSTQLYAHNENRNFLPASNMKLATSALALLRLGAEHRFVTKLMREPSGDLALIGGGDPSLSGRTYPYSKSAAVGDPLGAIEGLAEQAIAAGLKRVDGDIIGDDRWYPWAPYPPTWTQDDALGEDGAPVSALTLTDNVIVIDIRPGGAPGDLARLTVHPSLEYFAIDNRVATIAGNREPSVRMSREAGSRELLLWGSIATGRTTRIQVALDDPALYAAHALYDALTRRGIPVSGHPIARHRAVGDDETPVAGETLALHTSPPLVELLQVLDKVSQNLHAELMLREVGRVKRHIGTREAGLDELAAMLVQMGGAREDFRLEDGSGLSRNAQVTPRLMTRILVQMYASENRDSWLSLLPIGGEDGTLSRRLCCSSDAHNIRAKTGTLARAIALSGYADSRTHGVLAFSILVNNFSAPAAEIRKWIDKMALALVE
jgi:serine-type D-Ala-D-Ala carboxypeptidase/endopeptidase (penicillin-binding protein 4)